MGSPVARGGFSGQAMARCPGRPQCQQSLTPPFCTLPPGRCGAPATGGGAVSYTHLTLPTICSV
eukprot:15152386-Alexandrium_andersonii.AAC.1